jgi:energy-coupling factor transport system substrate-specific component
MTLQPGDDPQAKDTFDAIANDLRELRINAGVLPYAEIAKRIGRHRGRVNGDGVTDAPARSTVYDAFRPGRTRLNAELVGEIVRALGEDEQAVRRWKLRCYRAQSSTERNFESEPVCTEARVEPSSEPEAPKSRRPRHIYVGAVIVACVLLDLVGHIAVGKLHLALYLDMVGTATASIMLGPWYGVATALLGNAAGMTVHGPMALPFALVNAAGALVWGYGVRRITRPASFGQLFRLNFTTAIVCTLVAVPILVLGYHGGTGHEADQLTHSFTSSGQNLLTAVLLSNGITSILDKLVTGFIALAIVQVLITRIKTVNPAYRNPVDSLFSGRYCLPIRRTFPAQAFTATQNFRFPICAASDNTSSAS